MNFLVIHTKKFSNREKYKLNGKFMFEKQLARTTQKSRYSMYGLNLWNSLNLKLNLYIRICVYICVYI